MIFAMCFAFPFKAFGETANLDSDSILKIVQIVINSFNNLSGDERQKFLDDLSNGTAIVNLGSKGSVVDSTTTPAVKPTESKVLYRGIGSAPVLDMKTDNAGNIYVLYAKAIQKYSPDGKGVFRPIEVEGVFFKGEMTGKQFFATPDTIVGDALYYDEATNQMYLLAYFDGNWKFDIYKINDNLTLTLAQNCLQQSKSGPRTSWAGSDFLTKLSDGHWFYSSCEGVASVFYHLYNEKTYYKRMPMNAEAGDTEVIIDGQKVYMLSSLTGELIYYNLDNDEVRSVGTAPIASDTKVTSDSKDKAFYFSSGGGIFRMGIDGSLSEYISTASMHLYDNKLGGNDDICIDSNGNLIYTDRGFLKIKYKKVM